MIHLMRTVMIVSLLTWCSTRALFADEGDEFRQRIEAVQKQAARLTEQGQREQAELLQREIEKAIQDHERGAAKSGSADDSIDHEIATRQERLEKMAQEGQRLSESGASEEDRARMQEAIARLRSELQQLQSVRKQRYLNLKGHRAEEQPDAKRSLEEAGRRIKHLRAAAENLQAAGAGDLAKQLIEQAQSMEQEARRVKEMMAAKMAEQSGGNDRKSDIEAQLTELRQEVRRLRAEVGELRQQISKP